MKNPALRKALGQVLKQLRTEKELTQTGLSLQMTLCLITYRNWENSSSIPSLTQLDKLAGYYEMEGWELFKKASDRAVCISG